MCFWAARPLSRRLCKEQLCSPRWRYAVHLQHLCAAIWRYVFVVAFVVVNLVQHLLRKSCSAGTLATQQHALEHGDRAAGQHLSVNQVRSEKTGRSLGYKKKLWRISQAATIMQFRCYNSHQLFLPRNEPSPKLASTFLKKKKVGLLRE